MAEIPTNHTEPGVVYLNDWLRGTDGRNYICVSGRVSAVGDVELLGIKSRGGHNWALKIEGPSGQRVIVLGYMVKAVELGREADGASIDTWRVP